MLTLMVGGSAVASVYMIYRRMRPRPPPVDTDMVNILIDVRSDTTRFLEIIEGLRDEFELETVFADTVDQSERIVIRCTTGKEFHLWVSGPEFMRPLPRIRDICWDEKKIGVRCATTVKSMRSVLEEMIREI